MSAFDRHRASVAGALLLATCLASKAQVEIHQRTQGSACRVYSRTADLQVFDRTDASLPAKEPNLVLLGAENRFVAGIVDETTCRR